MQLNWLTYMQVLSPSRHLWASLADLQSRDMIDASVAHVAIRSAVTCAPMGWLAPSTVVLYLSH